MRKHLKYKIAGLIVLVMAALTALPVFAEQNQIANFSVEQAINNQPINWKSNKWGNNTTSLTYANGGQDGSKSLKVDVTKYTDGDAKWMHDAVTVKPSETYTYTSYYKSNVVTEIDLQYTHKDGSVSYDFVQIVPTSANWQKLTAEFETPATASKVVVMHIVSQVGWLQTDSFSLVAKDSHNHEEEENLIANGSFETVQNGAPASWNKNSWGQTTAQFTHDVTGRTGSRSATVKVTQYTDGDAKWFAEPVALLAGKTYVYRDFYKASRDTRVVAAYIDATGKYTYAELDRAPASADWRQYQASFVAPAGTVKATIFHVIDGVGSLTIDDALLQVAVPTSTNPMIPNASFEDASTASMPTSWLKSNWGNNTAAFAYMNEGRTGGKSAKVTLSNYKDGDAKWYFEPITTLKPGVQYRFTAWYKTNALPEVVAMYQKTDGSVSYVGLPQPLPGANSATTWQQYSETFTVPANVKTMSMLMLINQNGWLQTDDYSIGEYHPNGFNRPLLSLTFDDGHEDNTATALPLLNRYGFKSTQCYATTFIEGNAKAVQDVKAFQNSGHEICSHTVSHPFLTSLDSTKLQYELQHSRQYLESITGVKVDNFASPYGDYNPTVNEVIKRYYGSHRTVDEGFNSKDNFDQHRLRVQNILDTTTPEQVRAWIDQAKADKTWLILVYHRVAENPGPYDAYTSVFEKQLEVIKQSGIDVKTYKDALAEVKTQL